MHSSRIHQHIEKNSVRLKEVLTQHCERARSAAVDDITTRSRIDAKTPPWSTQALAKNKS